MVWLWKRHDQELELETRYDTDVSGFVLTLRWPDGRMDVERFADRDKFHARLVRLETELAADHWRNTGPPIMIPDGWPSGREGPGVK